MRNLFTVLEERREEKRRSDYRDQAGNVDACTLISSEIQLNYFAIAARPATMLVSDINEIRNPRCNLFGSALLVALPSYYVEIYDHSNASCSVNCYEMLFKS